MPDNVTIWTALADSKRRQIVNLLEEKPRTTKDLSEYFDVSRFAVMKHLKVLEQANLITVQREGRSRWNFLNEEMVDFLRTRLADDSGPLRLEDILGLSPGQKPIGSVAGWPADPAIIEQTILLKASPARVFQALTTELDSWWAMRHSAGSQIHLEPFVNGRFYEAFDPYGQGVLYGNVTYIKQDEELRLKGTLELAQRLVNTFAPNNFVGMVLESDGDATRLFLTHHIINGLNKRARDFTTIRWKQLLTQHLKPFVERDIVPQDGT